jgi:nucleotide-binding universal stress UspA family protein
MIVDAVVPPEIDAQGEFWVSLRAWKILDEAQPNILAVDIGTGPSATLVFTQLLAEQMQATVTILGFSHGSVPSEFKHEVRRRAQEAGLKEAEIQTAFGDLVQQVAAQCSRLLFELIVTPTSLTSSESELQRDVLTLLERADIPVLVIKPSGHEQIRKLLICPRAGEPGKSDIRLGGRLARYLGAEVTLLHVLTRTLGASVPAQRHLLDAAATLRALEVPNETLVVRDADPASVILDQSVNHELVVIGGRGPQSRSIFGRDDVAVQVLTNVSCPVLLVPAELA